MFMPVTLLSTSKGDSPKIISEYCICAIYLIKQRPTFEAKAGMAASLACRDARFSTSNACGSRIILMTSGPFPNAKKYDLSTYAATESALRGNKFN